MTVYALLLPQLLIPELAYRKEYVKVLLNEVSKKGHSEYRRENQGGGRALGSTFEASALAT
ncbi:hypothetical protein [Acidovorax sp. Leaf78]|uniref:hypothetical protein n=1 Tax=Acidovorax sp. Leaf78 TaxID=1736237 RepID=UPI00071559BA|nr:hypothetical protein [Acidovorax sp. Leaf78]KQO16935.1 hypothetical protein ASF16_13710 [Acidovorax sp. Leaf78]